MIKNYFIVACRNLLRNKAFSTINILGLSLGLTCSLLILLWVQDEKKVDAFHSNNKFLFQVYERNFYDSKLDANYATQGLLATELKKVIPEIEYSSGVENAAAPGSQNTFKAADKTGKMYGQFAGDDFFKMFSFPLSQGNANSALKEPGTIAISEKMAEYFFGNASKAIQQTIRFENAEELKITAVFKNIPVNSSLQFDFVRAWPDFIKQNEWVNNWGNTDPQTFIQLKAGADVTKVESKIRDFIYHYQPKDKNFVVQLALQPFAQRYLYSSFKNGYVDGGRIEYVRLFSIIAIFILLIACINFMNLATARAAKRAKEIGIRKVSGAMRSSLLVQFIAEAILTTLLAVVAAVLFASLLMPLFNQLTGKQLLLPFTQPVFYIFTVALVLLTGLVAGSYPAFFLSSLKPVKVLKSSFRLTGNGTLFRKGLVVFQFSISAFLIIATIVVYKQLHYIQTKNIGFNRESLVYIPIEGELVKKYPVFKQEALSNTAVVSVSKMRNAPTAIYHHTNSISWPDKSPDVSISFVDGVVGYDYVNTLKLQLAAGRDFSKDYGTDSVGFLLNETAVKKMNLAEPIGATVSWGNHQGKVIGVLKDFHFSSMHETIEPLIMRLDENWNWGTILVRIKSAQTKEAIANLEKLYKKVNPDFPFTYQFADDEFAKLYTSEVLVSKLANIFAFLAIFISCLGLFGLVTFTAEQRVKEIGVRKVLGASESSIMRLLASNFMRPIAIAMLIAFPLAWLAMNKWLQNYAYKISIGWSLFVLAALMMMVIALITISFQTIRSAFINPVKSLRTE